ncbi:protein involved in de novo 2 [Phtheirospermum japonicum]|uniref:Protein involved in de novo 2 n=1 Tax=Phtheirospermum japonicum TaxID=374723 RepID=A0A830CMV1_9LAMI|nr:protein involved in de novo 2 [Phtheirospermum japonicum]
MGSWDAHSWYTHSLEEDMYYFEAKKYEEQTYEELKNGTHQVKRSGQAYMCPYCPDKRKQDFHYQDILQHATAIGNIPSPKRTARDKANHLALARYLETDIPVTAPAGRPGPSKPLPPLPSSGVEADTLAGHDHRETFVSPFIGVVVNIPTDFKDGRYVGESGSETREQLVRRGFNPSRVQPLWDSRGHSGTAIVVFHWGLSGFADAMRFESAYVAYSHGKKNWLAKNGKKKSGLHAWVARAEDYNSNNIVGENIRKIGELRTLSDIMGEEARLTHLCPYCPTTKKRNFVFKDLFQHASSIGDCNSKRRSSRDKANHLALAKYLETHVVTIHPGADDRNLDEVKAEVDDYDRDHDDEKLVWPWTGIIVNIPTEFKDGRYVGESGSKLRDQLANRGFNPARVRTLWDLTSGHSGSALVEFRKDWAGFTNAMSFEKAYEASHRGKSDWVAEKEKKLSGDLYGWVARAEDYNSDDIVGEWLRKIGDLRTISGIMEEEARKTDKLVGNLTNAIEEKNRDLLEMETKFEETESALRKLILEKDSMHQAYNEEMKKIESGARDHFQKIFNEHEKLKFQLEIQKKDLELRDQELMKRETNNEIERKKLADELEQNAVRNCSLQAAAKEQRKADENVMKLAEEQKKEKERLHNRIIQLEKQLDAKQAVQLEIEQLRGKLNVVKHMGDEGDLEVLNKVEMLLRAMKEKERELQELDSLNQTLIVQEHKMNEELQEARKEMIKGLKEVQINSHIGIKRMGELDSKPFLEAMRKRYNESEADERAMELCSLWEEYLRDPEWHPLKVVNINDQFQAVINEDDEKLRELKENYGDEVYNAVTRALYEITEYNPSGSYVISELWNYNEDRRSSLKEGVEILLMQWSLNKRKR